MTDEMALALMDMYDSLERAAENQRNRGVFDQGARSKVTGGNHMNSILNVMLKDLLKRGYESEDLHYRRGDVALPGFFRASKQWDLLCFDDTDLMAVVEFKSINSSFGNNQNNRAEEALGNAIDFQQAEEAGLIPWVVRPVARCFALIVCDCLESRSVARIMPTHYGIDPAFIGTTYQQRFEILCRRMMDRHLFEAIWLTYVDPEGRTVSEPKGLSYELLIEVIGQQLRMNRMHGL